MNVDIICREIASPVLKRIVRDMDDILKRGKENKISPKEVIKELRKCQRQIKEVEKQMKNRKRG